MPQVMTALATQLLDEAPLGALIADANGQLLWCNKTLTDFLGARAADLQQRTLDSLDQLVEKIPNSNDVIVRAGNGRRERWLRRSSTACKTDTGAPCTAVFFQDVSNEEVLRVERDDLIRQMRNQASIEPVSGVLNQRAMLQNLEPLVSRSRRYNNPLSVVSIGVTNYQDIKTQLGEDKADEVIHVTGQLLKDKMRWTDLVSRTDTKTFVLILPETDGESAVQLTDKLSKELRQAQNADNDTSVNKVKFSFGVATWNKGDDSALLLRHAGHALEAATAKGPYKVERFI